MTPGASRQAVGAARAALLLLCALGILQPAQARDGDGLEYAVRAALLYNFARFASWPGDKLPQPDAPIRFCVLERDPLGDALAATLDGKKIDGHALTLQRVAHVEDMRACHVAYLGAAGPDALPDALAGSAVLTVYAGDATLPAGIVRFFLDGSHVRFEINTAAAEREKLELSSRLLGVASIVRR